MSTSPEFPATQIVENVEALWGIQWVPAGCPVCKQVFLVSPNLSHQVCPACVRAQLAPQPALLRAEQPELQIDFQYGRNDLLPIYTRFVNEVWLRPDDFNPTTLTQRAMPIFWPMWLVDSDVNGEWQAEGGYGYQVKSSKESFNGGGWRTQEVIDNRIRWEPRLGQIKKHYDNIPAPAYSEHNRLWQLVLGYRLDKSTPYHPNRLGAASVQVPDLQPQSAWPQAKNKLDQISSVDCQKAAAAVNIRNYRLNTSYEPLHWTQLLLPLYVTYYHDDGGKTHPIYINGQTGVIKGLRLASQRKGWQRAGWMVAAAVGLFLLSLLNFALSLAIPPTAILGLILAILSFGVGMGAIVPAVWPWQWNRRQQPVKITKI
jgi:hypothetical protein